MEVDDVDGFRDRAEEMEEAIDGICREDEGSLGL